MTGAFHSSLSLNGTPLILLQPPTNANLQAWRKGYGLAMGTSELFTIAPVRNIHHHQHQKALEDQLRRGLDAIKTLSRAVGFANVVVRKRLRNELRGKGVNVLRVVASILQVYGPTYSWKLSRQGILE